MRNNIRIGVIGLGYVGLPLAVEFAKKYSTTGFDISVKRVKELKEGKDGTLEVDDKTLKTVSLPASNGKAGLFCSTDINDIKDCNFYIVTVPTPVDKHNRPDLRPLHKASEMIGQILKKGDFVVYESTVYPGATEEDCIPFLEKGSGLKINSDFYVGYSPERINPGDKEHTVSKILKITSGSTKEAADIIDEVYNSVISAGTFKAKSIRVAEAAKVIENAQRDINIAFVNELAMILGRLGIDSREVLEAAGTKWNFLKFSPGLVGGHCIGVDPYYLAQKAQESGYHPEIILAGRRINDGMGAYIAHEVVKGMIRNDIQIKDAEILIMGITFKESCPDIRNTKVIDILRTLSEYNVNITILDPWADSAELDKEYGWKSVRELNPAQLFDAVILSVSHDAFKTHDIAMHRKPKSFVYDVKGFLPRHTVDKRL